MRLMGKSLTNLIITAAVFSAGAWMVGFGLFAATLPTLNPSSPTETADGIVVLTGGGGRLGAGIKLLAEKKGKRLLVSGVHPSVAPKDLLQITNAPQQLFDCCVDLDRDSANTIDNAEKSANWAKKNGYKSVYLVTADYHMRRSLLLLQNALPNCKIIAHPVEADISLQAIALEYTKFIVTFADSALIA